MSIVPVPPPSLLTTLGDMAWLQGCVLQLSEASLTPETFHGLNTHIISSFWARFPSCVFPALVDVPVTGEGKRTKKSPLFPACWKLQILHLCPWSEVLMTSLPHKRQSLLPVCQALGQSIAFTSSLHPHNPVRTAMISYPIF